MRKKVILLCLFLISCFSLKAQTDSYNQINYDMKAYTSVGDTVGIYADCDSTWKLMIPIAYSRTKVNTLGAALTYGIAKSKVKMEYRGNTSPYVFFNNHAHFKMYFGIVPIKKVSTHYMFSESYSLRDFSIAKFKVKKKVRQLTHSSFSIWSGVNSGVETDEDVSITINEIREGVYDIEINASPGEYCFVFTKHGSGVFKDVFDFTIK